MLKSLPELKAQEVALGRVYDRLFSSPDGQIVLDDLIRKFDVSADKDEVFAAAAVGLKREFLIYIETMRNRNAPT